MSRKQAPPESRNVLVEESAAPEADAETATPMQRFEALTRRLLAVTRGEMAAQQAAYEKKVLGEKSRK
jgi:hypothetical protein